MSENELLLASGPSGLGKDQGASSPGRDGEPPKWEWDQFRLCFTKGDRMIYPLANGNFVISEDEIWLPGSFPSFEKAEAAFDEDSP